MTRIDLIGTAIHFLPASLDAMGGIPVWLIIALAVAGIGMVVLHLWLARKNPVWLGAIVPTLYVGVAVVIATQQPPTPGLLLGHGLTLVVLLGVWWLGEDVRKLRRQDFP